MVPTVSFNQNIFCGLGFEYNYLAGSGFGNKHSNIYFGVVDIALLRLFIVFFTAFKTSSLTGAVGSLCFLGAICFSLIAAAKDGARECRVRRRKGLGIFDKIENDDAGDGSPRDGRASVEI